MVSIAKVVGMLSCAALLCLGLSHPVQADEAAALGGAKESPCERNDGQAGFKAERSQTQGNHSIQDEGLRVEDANQFMKGHDRQEVSLQTDQTTEKSDINQADRSEGNVNEGSQAPGNQSAKLMDRRNDHSEDCTKNSSERQ